VSDVAIAAGIKMWKGFILSGGLMYRVFRAFALSSILAVVSGCAICQEENRFLLTKLDRAAAGTVITNSTAAQVAAAPIAIPVAMTAGAIDFAILNPARAVVPAYRDTSKAVWEAPQGSDFRQAVLFFPKVVITPVVYAGAWTLRAFFTGID
jgi:hypothetical protein